MSENYNQPIYKKLVDRAKIKDQDNQSQLYNLCYIDEPRNPAKATVISISGIQVISFHKIGLNEK